MNEWINQSLNQSIYRISRVLTPDLRIRQWKERMNQSITQWMNEWINQSINQSIESVGFSRLTCGSDSEEKSINCTSHKERREGESFSRPTCRSDSGEKDEMHQLHVMQKKENHSLGNGRRIINQSINQLTKSVGLSRPTCGSDNEEKPINCTSHTERRVTRSHARLMDPAVKRHIKSIICISVL